MDEHCSFRWPCTTGQATALPQLGVRTPAAGTVININFNLHRSIQRAEHGSHNQSIVGNTHSRAVKYLQLVEVKGQSLSQTKTSRLDVCCQLDAVRWFESRASCIHGPPLEEAT